LKPALDADDGRGARVTKGSESPSGVKNSFDSVKLPCRIPARKEVTYMAKKRKAAKASKKKAKKAAKKRC